MLCLPCTQVSVSATWVMRVARVPPANVPAGESLASRLHSTCRSDLLTNARFPFLSLQLLDASPACSASFEAVRLKTGDWIVETRLDAIVVPGAMAGMYLAGSKGRVRLIRHGGDRPSITLMHDAKSVQMMGDFNGAPPLTLRLISAGGKVYGYGSRDGKEFRAFARGIDVAELGSDLRAGLILAVSAKGRPQVAPSMAVHYWREGAGELRPYR